jgi:hypothetical protein
VLIFREGKDNQSETWKELFKLLNIQSESAIIELSNESIKFRSISIKSYYQNDHVDNNNELSLSSIESLIESLIESSIESSIESNSQHINLSRDKTTSIFERVKVEADHHISLRMKSHHVTSRLALHLAYLQFVKLNRWESLTRFLHYSYYYHWSKDHFCSLSSLRDSYEPDTSLANSQ